MKKNLLFLLSLIVISLGAAAQGEFVTRWNFSISGPLAQHIVFNATIASGGANYTWETIPSGASGSGTLAAGTSLRTIGGFPLGATVRLRIEPQNLQHFFINDSGQKMRIVDVEQWGTASWTSMENAFYGCTYLNISATDMPDLSGVSNLSQMFRSCSMTGSSNIGQWNVSSITNMQGTFQHAIHFNQNLDNWDVSSVTNLNDVFSFALSFNQSLSAWSLNPNVSLSNALNHSGLDCDNYSATLIGWAQNNPSVTNRNLDASGRVYKFNAVAARNQLLAQGWTISDAGMTGPCNGFITSWNLSNPGSGATQITFNASVATGGANYTWETIPAGTSGSGTLAAGTSLRTISGIPAGAMIRLNIEPQNLQRFFFNNAGDKERIIDIEQWGGSPWTSMEGAFFGCSNLNISAVDIPILTGVSNMASMFRSCVALNGPANIGQWNVSNVSDMQGMFRLASNFNQDVSSWNVSNVLNMFAMFRTAAAFNQNLGPWTMSNAVNLAAILEGSGLDCDNYSATLSGWAANNPTALNRTLDAQGLNFGVQGAAARNTLINNQGWTINDAGFSACGGEFISVWNLANTGSAPGQITFNAQIATGGGHYYWETIPAGTSGSGSLAAGNTGRTITGIPDGATIRLYIHSGNLQRFYMGFNQPDRNRIVNLESWGNANWTSMQAMFHHCLSLTFSATDIPNLSGVSSLESMFQSTNLSQGVPNINSWNTGTVTTMFRAFRGATFNQDISNWNTSNVTNMGEMFQDANQFNQPIGSWNVSNVGNMFRMFWSGTPHFFNQNLGAWNLRQGVVLTDAFNRAGLNCNNYSQTLIGWAANNPNITNIVLDLNFSNWPTKLYNAEAIAARNQLLSQGWTITGDNLAGGQPVVVAPAAVVNAVNSCEPFLNPTNQTQKLLTIDPNGNSVDFSLMSATVRDAFVSSIPAGVSTQTSGNSGYYNMDNGFNVLRVSRRMFTIQSPDTYQDNGGVLVRVYFDQNDLSSMLNDPASLPIDDLGWFKSSSNDPQAIVDEMSLAQPHLASAVIIDDVTYGVENGIDYAEFLVESFSTFGMYAKHKSGPLPVTLTAFNTHCQREIVQLSWTTASEFNASHYTIQSSRDGLIWNNLGEIEAAGTTNQNTNYSFQAQNFGGLTYFRLVQVDLDGATEIFGPVAANCDIENNNMTVFPNPTADNFTVRIETPQSFENATLELVDMTGRVILFQTIDLNAGSTLLNFNGSELKAGTYFVRLKGENESFAPVRAVRM